MRSGYDSKYSTMKAFKTQGGYAPSLLKKYDADLPKPFDHNVLREAMSKPQKILPVPTSTGVSNNMVSARIPRDFQRKNQP